MTLNSRRLVFSFSLSTVFLLVLVTFLGLASAQQGRAERSAWEVTLPANSRSKSTITIRNQCKETHSFTVVPREVPYLQLPAAPTVQVPGRTNQAFGVVFNTTGLRPGDYRGSVAVKCESCGEERGCSQENEILPVHLTVTPAVGIGHPTPTPTPTATPRYAVSPTPTPTPTRDYLELRTGKIIGQKVNDLNCNGKIDTNEPGLAGWTITATNTGTGATVTTVTDANGSYSFNNLAPGTYKISEVAQAGWTQSMPGGAGSYTVTVAPGLYNAIQNEPIRRDFANCKHNVEGGKLTGRKINDLNCNGKTDISEPGLAGWVIAATNNGGGPSAVTVTDATGFYSFNLAAGTYTISENAQTGWTQTMPGGAGTYGVTLASGQVIQKDFANCKSKESGKITGRKINDVNCNGKTDINEPGLAGWVITATNNGTGVTVSTVTDANGFYSFNNLPTGTYTISESPQTGWTQTMPGGAGTHTVTVAAGQSIERDFANCKKPDEKECAVVRGREAVCKADGSGGYTYTFSVTNNSGGNVTQILLTPSVGSGLVLSDQTFPLTPALPNGQSTTITVDLGNVKPGTESCFFVTLMTKDGPCCTVKVCPVLPDCCATAKGEFKCDPKGVYTGTFTIVNTSPNTIKNIYLYPPAGVTMSQTYFAVTLAPGQSFTTPVITIKGAKPGRLCFRVSMHTEGMKDCCSVEVCIVLPECGIHIGAADTIFDTTRAAPAHDLRWRMRRRRGTA